MERKATNELSPLSAYGKIIMLTQMNDSRCTTQQTQPRMARSNACGFGQMLLKCHRRCPSLDIPGWEFVSMSGQIRETVKVVAQVKSQRCKESVGRAGYLPDKADRATHHRERGEATWYYFQNPLSAAVKSAGLLEWVSIPDEIAHNTHISIRACYGREIGQSSGSEGS